ncbi:MAG: cytochrome-c peroxidase [Ardenticatenaceae bacterium]
MINWFSILWFPKLMLGLLMLLFCLGCQASEGGGRELATAYNCAAIPDAIIDQQTDWNADEWRTICSLWLGSLPPLPPNPSNMFADDPEAAQLGEKLFFDPRFSANKSVSCATCHDPALHFTDGLPVAFGLAEGTRNTQTLIGIAYSPWFFWDGHKDSLWSQALEPLETEVEHGLSRSEVVAIFIADKQYREAYERMVGQSALNQDVTEVFVHLGKAMAAYERTLMPTSTRFDHYIAGILGPSEGLTETFTEEERAGLDLFINKGQCINCHNSPLFTNHDFHNTGVAALPDPARLEGAQRVQDDPFNCLSAYSDAAPNACTELRFIKIDRATSFGAFKTPTLRNIAQTAPYMHAGQLAELADVLQHYNTSPLTWRPPPFGHNELAPINLTAEEMKQVEAFLRSLTSVH